MERIAAEQKAIEKALEEALARTSDEHSAEVEELRRRLAEAEQYRESLAMTDEDRKMIEDAYEAEASTAT